MKVNGWSICKQQQDMLQLFYQKPICHLLNFCERSNIWGENQSDDEYVIFRYIATEKYNLDILDLGGYPLLCANDGTWNEAINIALQQNLSQKTIPCAQNFLFWLGYDVYSNLKICLNSSFKLPPKVSATKFEYFLFDCSICRQIEVCNREAVKLEALINTRSPLLVSYLQLTPLLAASTRKVAVTENSAALALCRPTYLQLILLFVCICLQKLLKDR